MQVRIGLYVSERGAASIDHLVARFARAETLGFRTAWIGHVFGHDALTVLALAGRATARIELGTWVVPTPLRHPVALAQQAITVQDACAGRLVLGIGASHEAVVERRFGLDASRPLRRMRETLDVLAPLLAGERVRPRGAALAVGLRAVSPPPILLGALGPKMLELAGARADGAALWLAGPRALERFALPRVRAAAARAGRPPPRIACGLPVCVTSDPAGARAAAESFLARSARLPAYRRILAREGARGVGDVAIVGDEEAVASRLRALADLGVTDFHAVAIPVPGDPAAPRRTVRFLSDYSFGSSSSATEFMQ